MKRGVLRVVLVGAMVIAMVVGVCGLGATSPLSVDAHTDLRSPNGWYGYHYVILVGYLDAPVADFAMFASPFGTDVESVFMSSFLVGGFWPGGHSIVAPFDFYQQDWNGNQLTDWWYERVLNGPLHDPVYPSGNDYVYWSGPPLEGPTDPEASPNAYYFGFCNSAPPGELGWRIDNREPPHNEWGGWDPVAAPVPEPSGLIAFGTGLAGLGGLLSRRRRR